MARTKQEIRALAKERRQGLSPEDRDEKSRCICSILLDILNGDGPVMAYVAKRPEVDTAALISGLIARGTRVVVPIIETKTVSLRLSYLDDPSVLVESTFHVPEPIGNEVPARPEEVGIAIVPLLAFDRRGNRLGYGAGYYDRFLAAHPALKTIGVAFDCQEIPELPGDPTDVLMDMIVTESGPLCMPGGRLALFQRNLSKT